MCFLKKYYIYLFSILEKIHLLMATFLETVDLCFARTLF
jgi:hypothetical protein